MNRTILFRGKILDGNWVIGQYIKACTHWHKRGIHEDWIVIGVIQNGGMINNLGRFAVIPETVGQFTGLCDKNGNKIFEGDILLEEEKEYSLEEYGEKVVGTHNIVAYWNEKACGFWVRRTDKPKGKIYVPEEPLCESFAEELKVVGNIYDNPELFRRNNNEI